MCVSTAEPVIAPIKFAIKKTNLVQDSKKSNYKRKGGKPGMDSLDFYLNRLAKIGSVSTSSVQNWLCAACTIGSVWYSSDGRNFD